MAALSNEDRADAALRFVRRAFVELNQIANVSHADVRAAINAADDWADANASSFNTALPQPFRGAATVDQKTLLLCLVILKRSNLA